MSVKKVALLFPGQGACYPGVLHRAARAFPEIQAVLSEVDSVAQSRLSYRLSDVVWSERPSTIEELLADKPAAAQLAIYSASIAVHRVLEAQGLRPDVLVGHSFGEIAALVCGGAFTVREGAEIVCDRTEAARLVAADGYMAALGANAATAGTLVSLVGNHDMVVAGENGETQTVLSGARSKMDRAADVARILNLGFIRLRSPYPFHSPLMEPVKQEFSRRLQKFTPRPLAVPVFSPIGGQYYDAADRLTHSLADHLVQPVRFGDALRQLYSEGVRVFVECGALDALTKLTGKVLQAPDLVAITCLSPERDEVMSLRDATQALRASQVLPEGAALPLGAIVPPALAGPDAEGFWRECGPAIAAFLAGEYEQFRRRGESIVVAASPVAQPVEPRQAAEVREPAFTAPSGPDRAGILRDLVSLYAGALEYPEEVFTEDVELEAELGVDSVKQTELLARVSDKYALGPRPSNFRLADYNTMGKVADFVAAAAGAAPAGVSRAASEDGVPAQTAAAPANTRDGMFRTIVTLYAAALEYPEEVFTSEVELEAELGIDSVKQTELLARVSEQFGLPPRPSDFRLADYNTLGKVVDFVLDHARPQTAGAAARATRTIGDADLLGTAA
jgi:malonyl CoA-acyl carrier protein transacylase/acyl carrier protein